MALTGWESQGWQQLQRPVASKLASELQSHCSTDIHPSTSPVHKTDAEGAARLETVPKLSAGTLSPLLQPLMAPKAAPRNLWVSMKH